MTQIITLANKGMIPLTDNLILNIRRVGMKNKRMVIYLDEFAGAEYFLKTGLVKAAPNIFNNTKSKYCEYGTKPFRNICMQKFPGIKKVLELTGRDAIYMDSDIGILKDFNPYFENVKADILCSLEYDGTYCCGFMYFRNTQNTLDFIDTHIEISSERIGREKYFDDQSIFNEIDEYDICLTKIAPLPESLFCNGHYMESHKVNKDMYTIHANCIRGIDKKIELLRKLRLYLTSS